MSSETETEMSRLAAYGTVGATVGLILLAANAGMVSTLATLLIMPIVPVAVVSIFVPSFRHKVLGFLDHMKDAFSIVAHDIGHAFNRMDEKMTQEEPAAPTAQPSTTPLVKKKASFDAVAPKPASTASKTSPKSPKGPDVK